MKGDKYKTMAIEENFQLGFKLGFKVMVEH
jgi:hypothetical protein